MTEGNDNPHPIEDPKGTMPWGGRGKQAPMRACYHHSTPPDLKLSSHIVTLRSHINRHTQGYSCHLRDETSVPAQYNKKQSMKGVGENTNAQHTIRLTQQGSTWRTIRKHQIKTGQCRHETNYSKIPLARGKSKNNNFGGRHQSLNYNVARKLQQYQEGLTGPGKMHLNCKFLVHG